MTKTLEALETLNNLLNGIDTSKYYDLLSEEEKQLEEEISDLDNGQVLWMGFGISMEQIEQKIELRKQCLKRIKAGKELLCQRH